MLLVYRDVFKLANRSVWGTRLPIKNWETFEEYVAANDSPTTVDDMTIHDITAKDATDSTAPNDIECSSEPLAGVRMDNHNCKDETPT